MQRVMKFNHFKWEKQVKLLSIDCFLDEIQALLIKTVPEFNMKSTHSIMLDY